MDLGLIRPSDGTGSLLIFFVRNRGDLRMVIDYRRVNKLTLKDGYPNPYIDELLDSFDGATHFATLDAASSYWKVPMAADSINKTGFINKYGTYKLLVMPFGLTSATVTFQRMMSNLLAPYIGDSALVFVDDIIVYSKPL